jgi:low affinity Fe/Cu permease
MPRDAKSGTSTGRPDESGSGKNNSKNEPLLTTKTAVWLVGAILAAQVGLATLHTVFVIPAILYESGKQTDEKIDGHGGFPHLGTVSRNEIAQIRRDIERMDAKLDRLIERKEDK